MLPSEITQKLAALEVDFDTSARAVTADGLEDFFNPMGPRDHVAFLEDCAQRLCGATRQLIEDGNPFADAVRILQHHVLVDAAALYAAHLTVARCSAAGHTVRAAPSARLLAAVAEGAAPDNPSIVSILSRGPGAPRRSRYPLRLANDLLRQSDVRRVRLFRPDFDRDIITFTHSPLISRHAADTDERVTYRRPVIWFGRGQPRPDGADVDLEAATAAVVDAVTQSFATLDLPVQPASAAYLSHWIGRAIALTRGWGDIIETNADKLPMRFWTGSSGDIWARILRRHVRKHGGHVTGHDHGTTHGHIRGGLAKTFVEFEDCDTFVTYSQWQADGLRHAARADLLIDGVVPEITSVPPATRTAQSNTALSNTGQPGTGAPKRVMYVSSFYLSDWVPYIPFVPDLAMLDWEARALAELVADGFEVLYKPRPPGPRTEAPAGMAEALGARTLTGMFEQMSKSADAFILIDPTSTTFALAFNTGKPVVFVDFGLHEFDPDAAAAMTRQCAVVEARFDADNRVQMAPGALAAALTAAPARHDTTFSEHFCA